MFENSLTWEQWLPRVDCWLLLLSSDNILLSHRAAAAREITASKNEQLKWLAEPGDIRQQKWQCLAAMMTPLINQRSHLSDPFQTSEMFRDTWHASRKHYWMEVLVREEINTIQKLSAPQATPQLWSQWTISTMQLSPALSVISSSLTYLQHSQLSPVLSVISSTLSYLPHSGPPLKISKIRGHCHALAREVHR